MTSTTTRTCLWPNTSGATDFDDTVESCGIADPSYDAHFDPTCDPLPVCGKHVDKARAAGHIITEAGEPFPLDHRQEIQLPEVHELPEVLQALALNPTGHQELDVMTCCAQLLGQLPADACMRAAGWLYDRFGSTS